jgi:hypothetical protein
MPNIAMNLRCCFVAAMLGLVIVTRPAQAQGPERPVVGETDLRLGAIWPTEAQQSLPSFGGRLALWTWLNPDGNTKPVSIQITGDFRRLDRVEAYDPDVGGNAVTKRSVFVLGPSVGFDLLRTGHVDFDVRVGGSLVAEHRSFGLDIPGGNYTGLNNLCAFELFRERCGTDWDFAGVVGLGLRLAPDPDGMLYFGADYSWLTRKQHQLVGTIGVRLR